MNSIKTKAPATLMLMGEHAVLHNQKAIVVPVEQYIHIKLTPRTDKQIIVTSELGDLELSLDNINIREPLSFVTAVLKLFQSKLTHGFNLEINSEFSSTLGLGSSAAVTVATVKALFTLTTGHAAQDYEELKKIFAYAKAAMLNVQKRGSGADIACSTFNQAIVYQIDPLEIIPLAQQPSIIYQYCGYKTPTVEVLKYISEKEALEPGKYQVLYQGIGELVERAIAAINQANWQELGALMDKNQLLLDQLGVNNSDLQNLIDQLHQRPDILGAKISGSGLGDCVIGLVDRK